ncbi:MAG: hypothetical protein J6N52_03955 [Clostridia bacterium]|nr:hypothetical protein [Clostridia bacterium]
MIIPILKTDNREVNMAFRIAVGDMVSNIDMFSDGILSEEKPVMMAGAGYDTPWTRDAAINTWNAGGLIIPEISKNTLLSVVICENGAKRVGGQYWDAIIWVTGAYNYWLYTGDEEFYEILREVTVNSVRYFEENEFDRASGLFMGAACYGDGVSAYTDPYSESVMTEHQDMMTLSTNCLYYNAYKIAYILTDNKEYLDKAEKLGQNINKVFWNEEAGIYDYMLDKDGVLHSYEGLGESFAILFGVADDEKSRRIVKNQIITPNGIPCLYPNFKRYERYGIGRHSGTVWPHIQAFWACAAARYDMSGFEHELNALTKNVLRDGFFSEIYHPESGERYGGVQEWQGEIVKWQSEKRQMWCATGYIRMIISGLLNMTFDRDGIHILPRRVKGIHKLDLFNLRYRNAVINIHIDDFERIEKGVFVPKDTEGEIKLTF